MDRLTRRLRPDAMHPNAADCAHCSGEYMTKRGCSMRCPLRKAQLERLAAYEDTGRMPNEVAEMIAENTRLRAELEAAKGDMKTIVDTWLPCDVCEHRGRNSDDEPCITCIQTGNDVQFRWRGATENGGANA